MNLKKNFSPFGLTMIVGVIICVLINCSLTHDWTVIPMLAAVFGVVNVVLSAEGRLLNYVFGVVTVSLYAIVAFRAGNYGDACENAFFLLPMQFFGFWQWKKRGAAIDGGQDGHSTQVQGRRLTWKWRAVIFVLGSIAIVIIALILRKVNATAPWVDATKTVLNIVAQILMAFAFMEQYVLWIAVNMVSVTLWVISAFQDKPGSVLMIIMWSFYLVISIYGLKVWMGLSKSKDLVDK